MSAKFRGQKTATAPLLTFPMPGVWKTGPIAVIALRGSRALKWSILAKDDITVFHISVPPQAKAEAAWSTLQSSFPHFTSVLFFSHFLLLSMSEAARSLLPLIGVRKVVSLLQQSCL